MSLRNSIIKNLDFISEKYDNIHSILTDLERMIHLDMQHSLMLQWWCENESQIDIINEILQRKEIN